MEHETETSTESQPFQAEVADLLRLMVHSVYSESEIFLRELISNASDACDKLRYEAIAHPELINEDTPLKILVEADADAGTLTVSDTGIGMSRQELTDNLGTIARSGTKQFVSQLSEAKEGASLIGQFGVGFYSAFMVADTIEVISTRAGSEETWVWRSSGTSGFEIREASEDEVTRVPRGTEIRLHVKEDAKQYLEPARIEHIVRLYSDHILFPIELAGSGEQHRQINSASAVWQRAKSELTEEDYKQSYLTVANAFDEPAATLHYKVEGRQAYAVLLFIPSQPPFDLFDQARKGRIRLYVRRVFITDDADLLPAYLRFVRGVIDSEDLPLNISREMLQNNPHVQVMRNAVTGRVLTELEQLRDKHPDKFSEVWAAFGAVIKEGIYEDHERRARLLDISSFTTTASEEGRSLKQYVADMKSNQTEIYYLVGDTANQLRSSPKLEAARARGIEVLLLTDHVDAFWTAMPIDYDGKPFKSLSQGDVDLGLIPLLDPDKDDGEDAVSSSSVDQAVVTAAVKGVLGELVSEVRQSQRLIDSPVCLVAGTSGPDRKLDRILSQTNAPAASKPILELNPKHQLIRAIANAKAEARDDDIADLAHLLFEQAQILDGEVPDDPAAFAERLNRLIARAF